MRICRFDNDRLGLVEDDRILDVSEALSLLPAVHYPPPAEDALIANLAAIRRRIRDLAGTAAGKPIVEARLLSPVAAPGKLIGAPVNYARHLDEARTQVGINHGNAALTLPIHEIGLFLKANTSLVGAGTPIALRFPERRNDHELELAVIIGKHADRVSAEDALSHVAGYTMGLDMTVRGKEDRSFRKSIDTYSVLGPWMVTADELGDPSNLDFELRVNGEVRQSANTSELILSVPELIAFASRFYALRPGDVIFTGTPEGVAPVFPGDVMEARMQGIGEMRVRVGEYAT